MFIRTSCVAFRDLTGVISEENVPAETKKVLVK